MIYFLGLPSAEDILRTISMWLCKIIYPAICGMYDLFIQLSKVNILSSDDIVPIYEKVTMILAIIMVFYVTLEFVKYVVQPDKMTDKEAGVSNIAIKMIVVVVLIAMVPKIFEFAYKVQNKIFENQIFSKVILGKQNIDSDSVGKGFATNIFSTFYSVNETVTAESEECDDINCQLLVNFNLNMLNNKGKLDFLHEGLNEKKKLAKGEAYGFENDTEVYLINFKGMFAIVIGGFILYMLVLYCVDVGVRVAQLAFLQIIAPIPIIGYLSPKKDGIFQKWTKQCVTTYLDIFLREGIIYFVILLCQVFTTAYQNGTLLADLGNISWLGYIFIIMGLLLFADKAPKMLGELFPQTGAASGNFGLKASKRVAPTAARAIGAGLGGAKNMVGHAIRKSRAAAIRNKINGVDNSKEGREKNKNLRNQMGAEARKTAAIKGQKRDLEKKEKANQEMGKLRSKVNETNAAKRELEAAKQSGDQNKISKAQQKFNQAEKEQKEQAKRANEANKAYMGTAMHKNTVAQNKESIAQNNANYANAKKAYDNIMNDPNATPEQRQAATKALEEAKNNSIEGIRTSMNMQQEKAKYDNIMNDPNATPEEKEAAKKAYEDTRIKFQDAIKPQIVNDQKQATATYFDENGKEAKIEIKDTADLERQFQESRDKQIEISNQMHKSVSGAALTGAIRGFVSGAEHGIQSKELKDIPKNINAANRELISRQQELNKYYDSGGEGGFKGYVNRSVQSWEKRQGFDTDYDRAILEAKSHEAEIKNKEASSSVASASYKSVDTAKNTIKGAISKTNLNVRANSKEMGAVKTEIDELGLGGVIKLPDDGKTSVKNISSSITQQRKNLEIKNEEKQKQLAEKAKIFEEARTSRVSGKQLIQAQNDYYQARKEAELTSNQVRAAEQIEALTQKKLTEYQFNELLKNKNGEQIDGIDEIDYEARTAFNNLFNALEIAAQNPELVSAMSIKLRNIPNGQEKFQYFITANYPDYATLKDIAEIVNNIGGEFSGEAGQLKERQRAQESSISTQAMRVASEFKSNPNGDK